MPLLQYIIIEHAINCNKSNCNQYQSKIIDWHYLKYEISPSSTAILVQYLSQYSTNLEHCPYVGQNVTVVLGHHAHIGKWCIPDI